MTAQQQPFLAVNNISKKFGDFSAVNQINLAINQGEIFALLGSSGCGKSTLLRLLAGFEQASDGELWLDGECLNGTVAEDRPINMMFQSYALFPHMTVAQNLAYGLKRDGVKTSEVKEKVALMLELVQMAHLAKPEMMTKLVFPRSKAPPNGFR